MSFTRRLGLPLLALIASCGDDADVGGVSEETPAVGEETRAAGEQRRSGFVVFGTTDGTLVYDVARGDSFRVDGQPVRDDGAIGEWDEWAEIGFLTEDVHDRIVASDDGNVILVRTSDGVAAIDLPARRVRATFHGEAAHASIAPDGSAFVAMTAFEKSIVDTRDGTITRVASTTLGGPPLVLWREDIVTWTDEDGAHLFDRGAHADTLIALHGAHGVDRSPRFVFWNEREVQVWDAGASKPVARAIAAGVADVTVDHEANRIGWVEYDGDHAWIHTFDVRANVHLRFPSRAERCSLGPERIVEIRGTELVTDEECTTGCPSFERRPAFVAYDFASGSFTRRWAGPVSPPPNDGLSARMTEGDRIARLFGYSRESGEPLPLRLQPSRDIVLAPHGTGLRLGNVRDGATLFLLEGSEGFTPADVTFAREGAMLVGRRTSDGAEPGAIAVWEASTGRRLFHAGVSALR